MRNSFFLVIPEQKKAPELVLSYEESNLRQWVADLPAANPSLSTRLLLDQLADMNTVEMPATDRLTALEIIRPHFLQIQDFLRTRLIQTGFPKTLNEQKIMGVLSTLEKQLCIGYWICVKQLSQRNISWFQSKHLGLALQRTLKGLSTIALTHFIMNKPVPEWVWIDLHSLYKLSKKHKKETVKIPDASNILHKSSVEDCYKQILLLSLADPATLMQREFTLCYHFIEKLTSQISLQEEPVNAMPKQCLIQTDEDIPPFFESQATPDSSARLFIDLTRLNKIQQHADKWVDPQEFRYNPSRQDSDHQPKLAAALFNQLMQSWQGKPLQNMPLFSDRIDRLAAIGLDATYELQSNLIETKSPLQDEIQAESFSEKSLSIEFKRPNALSIGSLVSVRRIDAMPQQRALGVVTRLKLAKQDNKLIFEPKLISQQVFPATYIPFDADKNEVSPQKALLYAITKDNIEKTYIILDSFSLKRGDLLRLFFNNEDFPIILNHRTNIGLGYWQFECGRLEEKQVAKVQPKKKGFDFI